MENALYRTIWRWHFYAGLLVMPVVIVLSISGALYLFKPQVERWEERAFQNLPTAEAVSPSVQVAVAQAILPGASLVFYRLPERSGDAAMVHFALPDSGARRDVFVSPQGKMLGVLDPERRIIALDKEIHGQLLLGRAGSWLVELVASWAIVLILSGLFLWWPRSRSLAGVIWPRLGQGRRIFWRDLHSVTGFWVAGLALLLLFTGLPWADFWGSAFKMLREEAGWTKGAQDWTTGGRRADVADAPHAEHGHVVATSPAGQALKQPAPLVPAILDRMVAKASRARLSFPVLVVPPGAASGKDGGTTPIGWTVKSDTQNRPSRVTLHYDPHSGALIRHEDFASQHPIDQVVAYGIAWHEGQLFGWVNQFVGLLTALMMIILASSGLVMWRRRKPKNALGAPAIGSTPLWPNGWYFRVLTLFLLIWLPLFTASIVLIALLERIVVRRIPRLAAWLGLRPASTRSAAPN